MWSIGSPSTLVSPCLTPGKRKGYVCAVSPSPDGRFLAVLRSHGELQIWRGGTQHVLIGATRTYHGSNTNFDNFENKSQSSLVCHKIIWRGDSTAICCFELKSNSLCFFSVVSQDSSPPVLKLSSSWSEPQTHLSVTLNPLFALVAPPSNPANSMIQRTSLPSSPTSVSVLAGSPSDKGPTLLVTGCVCGALLMVKFDGSILRVFPSALLPHTQSAKKPVTCFMERLSCSRQPNGLVLIGAVLSDGRAWAALLATDLSEVLYTFNFDESQGLKATSIAVQGALLAIGWWCNKTGACVKVYRIKSSSSSVPWKLSHHVSLDLAAWGWNGMGDQASNVGAAHFACFSESGDSLMVAYTRRGVVVWCPRQGTRLFTTLPDLSPEPLHAAASKISNDDFRVRPAPAGVNATTALACGGVSCLALCNQGYQLVVVPASANSSDLTDGRERDTCMVVMNLLRGNDDCTLTSHNSVAVLDRVPSLPQSDLSSCGRFRWRLIPLPPHYAASNAPIRFVAMSEQGHVAASGRRGLALLQQCSPSSIGTPGGDRWRLFGNAQEERSMCALACAFAGDMLVLCNSSTVEVYPRHRLDTNSVIASALLEDVTMPRFLQVLHDTSTVVLVADDTHFVVFELELGYSDGDDLYAASAQSPQHLTKLYEGHFFEHVPKTVLLARQAGRVVVIVLDINGTLSSMDPFENSRQVVLEDTVTEIWPFTHAYAALSPMFLILDRSQHGSYLRAWVPLLPDIGSPVLLPVDSDEKVLAPLPHKAVLVTVRHEVDRSVVTGSEWHGPPLHEPQPVFRPILGAPLRLLVQEAVKRGVHRKHLAGFVRLFALNSATQAGLAMALEHLIVDTTQSKSKKEIACLLDVVWHEANYCFHALVASAARQMDPSRSALLFSCRLNPEFMPRPTLCHSPATLSRDCISRGLMATAASYLALMGPPEPNTAALSTALEVLGVLLEGRDRALLCEVWGFLGRHVTAGKQIKIVVGEEGCSLSMPHTVTSRGETLSVFVVTHLQTGDIATGLRPLQLLPELLHELLPCSIVSSSTIHQQLLSAFLAIEQYVHVSKLGTEEVRSHAGLRLLSNLSKNTQYHIYRIAADTLLGNEVAKLVGTKKNAVSEEVYHAVLEVLALEMNWCHVLPSRTDPLIASRSESGLSAHF